MTIHVATKIPIVQEHLIHGKGWQIQITHTQWAPVFVKQVQQRLTIPKS